MVEFDRQDLAPPRAAEAFADLALELHNSPTMDETVEAVVQFALQALECSYAGVALAVHGGKAEIAAVTDPVVADIFQLQIDSRNGPLVTALQEQTTVLIRDTTDITDAAITVRWHEWAGKVAALGVRSVLDVPLATTMTTRTTAAADGHRKGGTGKASTTGVLGLYSNTPDAFSADDEAIADILARHASIALAEARHDETMARAVDARKLVGQAMGILMERFDIDADRAFAILRRYSQNHNIKLRDVAQHLIDTRKLPGDSH